MKFVDMKFLAILTAITLAAMVSQLMYGAPPAEFAMLG
jgi:hypothetical protein